MRRHFQLKETIVSIIADEERYINEAIESIKYNRKKLEQYISRDPFFKITFEPYESEKGAPEIVQRMSRAAKKAGVGPMAAVAGTIAELAVEAMMAKGATHAIVDNGGDIAILNDRKITIGIYTGESPIKDLGFEIEPRDKLFGICTSSGTIGPSISLGNADAATIIARSASLADACATALCNAVQDKASVEMALSSFNGIEGVEGGMVVVGDTLATCGKTPKIIKVSISPDCITRA